jgi:hypothetical protein
MPLDSIELRFPKRASAATRWVALSTATDSPVNVDSSADRLGCFDQPQVGRDSITGLQHNYNAWRHLAAAVTHRLRAMGIRDKPFAASTMWLSWAKRTYAGC